MPIRLLAVILFVCSRCAVFAQGVPPASTALPVAEPAELKLALAGRWVGVLEYRDYSAPPESNARVQLPTWLTVLQQPEGVAFRYVYDDGPGKVVVEENTVVFDTNGSSYRVLGTDGVTTRLHAEGLNDLKSGRGKLLLTGPGTENGKPVEVRITMRVGRNLLTWTKETRPAGGSLPFAFRDSYVLTRADPPPTSSAAAR